MRRGNAESVLNSCRQATSGSFGLNNPQKQKIFTNFSSKLLCENLSRTLGEKTLYFEADDKMGVDFLCKNSFFTLKL